MYSKTVPVAAMRNQHDTSRYTPYGSCGRPALPPPPPASSRAHLQSSEQRDRAPRCVSRRQEVSKGARAHAQAARAGGPAPCPRKRSLVRSRLRVRSRTAADPPPAPAPAAAARHPPAAVPHGERAVRAHGARARAPPRCAPRAPPLPCAQQPPLSTRTGLARASAWGVSSGAAAAPRRGAGQLVAASARAPERIRKLNQNPEPQTYAHECVHPRGPHGCGPRCRCGRARPRRRSVARTRALARSLARAITRSLARECTCKRVRPKRSFTGERSPRGCGARRAPRPRACARAQAQSLRPPPPLFPPLPGSKCADSGARDVQRLRFQRPSCMRTRTPRP